jgi:hypothetical protein
MEKIFTGVYKRKTETLTQANGEEKEMTVAIAVDPPSQTFPNQ